MKFDGVRVASERETLTILGLSGKIVATGSSSVSTQSLQPGIYIAKAGTKTLKILVK